LKRAVYSSPIPMLIRVAATLILLAGTGWAGSGGPPPAVRSLPADGQMRLSPSDRCPVCAMFPARHPEAAAAMTLKNGETFYFCGNGCLLRAWLRPTVYLGKPRDAIDRLVVQDYFSGRPIDGRGATWIAGSDVVGPMGPAIVALGNADQVIVFKKRHGGKTIFSFEEIDDALWQKISRRSLPAAKTE